MPLPGHPNPQRSSPIKLDGATAALVLRCRVVRCDTKNYTVDLVSIFDRKTFLNVPVGSPYVHFQGGAGWFAHALEKAIAYVTIPSDTSPPFVQSFVAPVQGRGPSASDGPAETTEGQIAQEEGEQAGVAKKSSTRAAASYAANRPDGDEGDMFWRWHDGNTQIVLRSSGILEIGSGALCQRVYLPLSDKMLDVFREYEAQTSGGSVHWGVQRRQKDPTQKTETYRLYAGDKYADMRIRYGVVSELGEPTDDKSESSTLADLAIGEKEICLEVVLAAQAFQPGEHGDEVDSGSKELSVFRFFFDKDGGFFLRSESSALVRVRKNLTVRVGKTLTIEALNLGLSVGDEAVIQAKNALRFESSAIIFQGGSRPVAAQGDQVILPIPSAPVTGTLNGQPFAGILTFPTGNLVGQIQVTQQTAIKVP